MNRQDQIALLRKSLVDPNWQKDPASSQLQIWKGKEASDYLSTAYRAPSTKPNVKPQVIDPILPEDLESEPED